MSERVLRVDGTPFEADADRPGWRALAGEPVRDVDVLVRRPDGTDLVLRISGQHLPAAGDGRPARAVLSMHDVTRDLERAEALRQFARVAAHDIRNPVAAIDGWNTMLRRKAGGRRADPRARRPLHRPARRLGGAAQPAHRRLLDHATSADRTLALTRIELGPLLRRIVESRGAEAWSPGTTCRRSGPTRCWSRSCSTTWSATP